MHATAEEAREETMRMLNVYADFLEDVLAMPVVKGRKTDKEKFNGAEETYTVECMMHDHKALQSGTSHYFGDGFAKAFDITFTGKDNQLHHPHQTSWGVSTRMIGGIIMTHGDNNGLVLPPRIAPIQVMVIPVAQHKEGVLDAAAALLERLQKAGVRARMDDSDQSMGWKAAEYEMKGVPLRVEIGPKDMEKNQCCICRRDTGEKIFVPLSELEEDVRWLLDEVHKGLYNRAKKNLEDHTRVCMTLEEVKDFMESEGGFAKTMWCGELDCELAMKERAGVTSRCMPLEQERVGDTCVCCGKPARHSILWGVAY
jgi:prolyl-tRNA synthetase